MAPVHKEGIDYPATPFYKAMAEIEVQEALMVTLRFTTNVLGPLAAHRLENQHVTQTIRGENSEIVQANSSGKLKVGDQIQIMLDDRLIGLAEYVMLDAVLFDTLDQDDANRSGFDTLEDLATALRRAGYRFKPVNSYWFYRVQFSWLVEEFA